MHRKKIKFAIVIAAPLVLVLIWLVFVTRRPGSPRGSANTPQAVASETLQACNSGVGNQSVSPETCYAKKFVTIAQTYGHEFAFAALTALQQQDPKAQGCHLIAHGIGEGAYKRAPADWQKIIREINPSCSYGAIHGVIENYVATLPEKKLTPEVIPVICGSQPRADCNHIVGHLILVETKADVKDGLNLCEIFRDSTQKHFCLTGLFMEYQTALNLIAHGLVPESWLDWPKRTGELEKMCHEQNGEAAVACWEEIVHAELVKFDNDPKKMFELCASAQVLEGAMKCRRHAIGIIAASKNFELPKLKSMCLLPQSQDPGFEADCYQYLVASTLSTIPQAGDRVVSFCSGLPQGFQRGCFEQMTGVLRQVKQSSEQELADLCKLAPENVRSLCAGAVHIERDTETFRKD